MTIRETDLSVPPSKDSVFAATTLTRNPLVTPEQKQDVHTGREMLFHIGRIIVEASLPISLASAAIRQLSH